MSKEIVVGSTNINLVVFKHCSEAIYMPTHPGKGIFDMRDWYIEKSTAILGVRRTAKKDVYDKGLSSEHTTRMVEWSVLGRRIAGSGREVNPSVSLALRKR